MQLIWCLEQGESLRDPARHPPPKNFWSTAPPRVSFKLTSAQEELGELDSSSVRSLNPWPNGVASQRKLGNVNLRSQWTCDGWLNALASTRKLNASSKKAISVPPCTCARTKENNTETNLNRLALGGQTVKNLRSLAYKFELDQSERKSSQVHSSHGQMESQVNTSFQLATPFGQGLTQGYQNAKKSSW